MKLSENQALKYAKAGRTLWRVWGHVHTDRFTRPHTERLEFYARSQTFTGSRGHSFLSRDLSRPTHILNGSYGGYWTKRKQAEKFAQEIMDGMHPYIYWASLEREEACDHMDESLGICDRGLGGFDPGSQYQHDEL